MTDPTTPQPEKLPGVPEPDPPEGGPNANPDVPDPADLTPGFGGTSKTRPPSTEEDDNPD